MAESDIVIDIPERIKLETDLMVKVDDYFEAFDQRSTLFSARDGRKGRERPADHSSLHSLSGRCRL